MECLHYKRKSKAVSGNFIFHFMHCYWGILLTCDPCGIWQLAFAFTFDCLHAYLIFCSWVEAWKTHIHVVLTTQPLKSTHSETQGPVTADGCLTVDWPTMVCLVLASWLITTFSCPPWPSGLAWVNLKKSTATAGFFQSTWIESSVWPSTLIPSIPETSEEKTRLGKYCEIFLQFKITVSILI